MKKFAAHRALMPDGRLAENPLITVGDDGRIAAVEHFDPSQLDGMAGMEFHSGILAPALVNAHCHLELSYLRGAIPEGCGFAGFAAAMAAVRNDFTDLQRREAAETADREMYDGGTGFAGDIANDPSAFGVKSRGRLRYRTFCEVFGLRTDNLAEAERMLRFDDASLTPHSLYSLNDPLFKRITHTGSGTLSIHFMESPAERELFEGRGPLAEWFAKMDFRCDFLRYGSPAERLTACTPPDRSVMLVHCTCVTQRDIDIIMNHFRAPVYWCLCPRSNDYISGLRPDVELLRRNGLNICTGTDSLASNRSLSMAAELSRFEGLPAAEVLGWATRNGAAALGLDEGAGMLAEGSRCGLVAVGGTDPASRTVTRNITVRRLA